MAYYINGYDPSWGSHIPVLVDVFNNSEGPVLELGIGVFSTPLLHALCVDNKRQLVSYENNPEFFKMHASFIDEFHQIKLINDWDKIDIESTHWGMVLVDHRPAQRRNVETKRLMNNADYVVIHDSEPRLEGEYRYDLIYHLFKYRLDYILKPNHAHTTILSNFKDLRKLKRPR